MPCRGSKSTLPCVHATPGATQAAGVVSEEMTPTATPASPRPAPVRGAGEPTDVDLVARVRRGDEVAFERLYARYQRPIGGFVGGMVRDSGRTEDIVQEVFLSAFRRLQATEQPVVFRPWLFEIARNASIDHFRRAQRAQEVSIDAGGAGLGAADRGRLVTTSPAPDVAVDHKESLDHLRGAFGELSDAQHQVLVLRELEGCSYREIGERLGMSRPSVESTLFRARRRLTAEYADLASGERCVRVQRILAAAPTGPGGGRAQRRLAAHLSHCQPCRRAAHEAGLDLGAIARPGRSVRTRVAAFLPLPAFLRRGSETGSATGTPGASSGHAAGVVHWSASAASTDPAFFAWLKAAATAATVAAIGLGAGAQTHAVGGQLDRLLPDRPASASPVPRSAAPVTVSRPERVAGGAAAAGPPVGPAAAGTSSVAARPSTGATPPRTSPAGPGKGAPPVVKPIPRPPASAPESLPGVVAETLAVPVRPLPAVTPTAPSRPSAAPSLMEQVAGATVKSEQTVTNATTETALPAPPVP